MSASPAYPGLSYDTPWGYRFWKFVVTVAPGYQGYYFMSEGENIAVPVYGFYSFRLSVLGQSGQFPWVPINVSGQLQPETGAYNFAAPELLLHANAGVTIDAYNGLLQAPTLVKSAVG